MLCAAGLFAAIIAHVCPTQARFVGGIGGDIAEYPQDRYPHRQPKQIAPLTELQVRKAKPTEQPYRLADGKGLYLQVMPNGSRYWRMKYRFDGKEKLASFGVYPEVTLAEARKACLAARQLLTTGTDPSEQKKEVKRARALEAVSTFEAVAREWFESQNGPSSTKRLRSGESRPNA